MLKFFRLPFATTGDKTAVPDAVDSNGNVSYSQGYGLDYQRQKTDPAAKNIERDKMNQVLFDITSAIAELQSQGAPDFITSALNGGAAYSYAQFAIVKYSGALYISLVAANTALPSDATKWALLPTPALLQQSAYMSAVGAGTVDAITAAFTPAIAALPAAPGTLSVFVRATGANTSTTPTFKADGTTAKTIVKGNNVALLAGDIAGVGHWLELQYDATLDKWVLQNPTHGFGGTPPQFDNTTKTATTAFVQRALGNFQYIVGVNAPFSLSALNCGQIVAINTPGQVTLPLASSVTSGAAIGFLAATSGASVVPQGGNNIYTGGSARASIALGGGDSLLLVSDTANWYVYSGSAQLQFSSSFGSSLGTAGYQRLPSGLILQWGRLGIGDIPRDYYGYAGFPIVFPNNVYQVNLSLYSYAAGDFDASAAVTVNSQIGFNFTVQEWSGSVQNLELSYFAIGN